MRGSSIEIMRHEGYRVEEEFFGRDAFYVCKEAFMCGTAAEVTPIRELDRRTVGNGSPGRITRQLQEIYGDAVRGRVDWLKHYITHVN